jgi:hypothetical protein
MSWSFSFQLLPDEKVIDDSTKRQQSAIRPAYSVFLTNRRSIFRFDGFGSSLTKAFFYNEILEVRPAKRLFLGYLVIKTKNKEYLFNTSEPEYWSQNIISMKKDFEATDGPEAKSAPSVQGKREFLDMLVALRKNALLTEEEFEEKTRLLDTFKP